MNKKQERAALKRLTRGTAGSYSLNQKVQVFAHRNTKRAKTRTAQKARALADW
jgi:hypothetical protein